MHTRESQIKPGVTRRFIRFVYSSYLFKVIILLSLGYIIIFWISNKSFDSFWGTSSYQPLTNLYEVYNPPVAYDNVTKIKLKLVGEQNLAIEGNKKLQLIGAASEKDFAYYDTTEIKQPEDSQEYLNKIFFRFENSYGSDSIYLVVAKSGEEKIYWNQIFYSSVMVEEINDFSGPHERFRMDDKYHVESKLLEDNDTLINLSLSYFNAGKDTMKVYECGTNSSLFKSICDKVGLPSRIIGLQGGDADVVGFGDEIGYPLHAVCEVYSSRLKKWYVIDPTYGVRFKDPANDDYFNAVEIGNRFFFKSEKDMVQDAILFTRRSLVGRDYFKYYENIFFNVKYRQSIWVERFLKYLFNNSDLYVYQYSNNLKLRKNAYYYLTSKSIMYLFLTSIFLNTVFLFVTRRLYKVKKPKN